MNEKKYQQIVASVSNYDECDFRQNGGGCKATTIEYCRKKCRFFTVPMSKYKEKTIEAYERKEREIENLKIDMEKERKSFERKYARLMDILPEIWAENIRMNEL